MAAVLAADVAGYSRMMGRDEEGTLARLKSLRKTLFDRAITPRLRMGPGCARMAIRGRQT